MTNNNLEQTAIRNHYHGIHLAKILIFDQIPSTNAYTKSHHNEFSNEHPSLILAEQQTSGYGRFKRDFYSPAMTGIYMSVVLPINLIKDPNLLTLTAGISTVTSLSKTFPDSDLHLKWVNDILFDDKKCGGILAESVSNEDGAISKIILGIGLNINTQQFPNQLNTIANSLSDRDVIDRNIIIADILSSLLNNCQFSADKILPKYRALCTTIGRSVTVQNGNKSLSGQAIDVTDNGALILLDDKKNRHLINSGEVTKILN